jgi:hypothetical protein
MTIDRPRLRRAARIALAVNVPLAIACAAIVAVSADALTQAGLAADASGGSPGSQSLEWSLFLGGGLLLVLAVPVVIAAVVLLIATKNAPRAEV